MNKVKGQEKKFELKSEKVRSIVGQVPTGLVRYGTIAIGIVLCILACICYYLPYKRVYTGTATIKQINSCISADSVHTEIYLWLEAESIHTEENLPIVLSNGITDVEGIIYRISATRDTLGRQEAQGCFADSSIEHLKEQIVDFRITQTSGTILSLMLRL